MWVDHNCIEKQSFCWFFKTLDLIFLRESVFTIYGTHSISISFNCCTDFLPGYVKARLALWYMMLKNGQTYFKNLVLSTPQDFKNIFDYILTPCMKGSMKWKQRSERLKRLIHGFTISILFRKLHGFYQKTQ